MTKEEPYTVAVIADDPLGIVCSAYLSSYGIESILIKNTKEDKKLASSLYYPFYNINDTLENIIKKYFEIEVFESLAFKCNGVTLNLNKNTGLLIRIKESIKSKELKTIYLESSPNIVKEDSHFLIEDKVVCSYIVWGNPTPPPGFAPMKPDGFVYSKEERGELNSGIGAKIRKDGLVITLPKDQSKVKLTVTPFCKNRTIGDFTGSGYCTGVKKRCDAPLRYDNKLYYFGPAAGIIDPVTSLSFGLGLLSIEALVESLSLRRPSRYIWQLNRRPYSYIEKIHRLKNFSFRNFSFFANLFRLFPLPTVKFFDKIYRLNFSDIKISRQVYS